MTRLSFATLLVAGVSLALGAGVTVTIFTSTTAGMGASPAAAAPVAVTAGADAAHPTVVELFESQGCSDCPPANANVNALAQRPDILALNFAVTYWDQLGWKDTFAKPAYTARQWDYARAAGRAQVATPQVIINGSGTVVGSNAQTLAAAIRDNARGRGPAIAVAGGKVMIGRDTGGKGAGNETVWLVQYDPRTLTVPIRAGENDGRTLDHRNVVRALDKLGMWRWVPARFTVPAIINGNYRRAIVVQQGVGGKIVAAARI